MPRLLHICILALGLSVAHCSDTVLIESFDNPKLKWQQQNDPVMGGRSTGTFNIDGSTGIFDGDVVDVPSLKAPGFIKATGSVGLFGSFADASSCSSLVLTARSTSPAYKGFRVSIGSAKPPGGKFFAYGYKAHFDAPTGDEFVDITIPFTNFSDYWDDATGDLIKTCQDDKMYCPDRKTLHNMRTMSIWAEGVAGKVHLELKSIHAAGCSASSPLVAPLPEVESSCSGPVQINLRYNVSNTKAYEDWSLPVPPNQSLAEAVCCYPPYKPYAEPPQMFARPDVALFAHLEANGTTTFYDSVCGIPLFIAPRGRSLAEFKADTTEHGWPSFRQQELVTGNSRIVNATGEVVSKCGTHLGSFLPDDKGARWCLDLSCVAGNPH